MLEVWHRRGPRRGSGPVGGLRSARMNYAIVSPVRNEAAQPSAADRVDPARRPYSPLRWVIVDTGSDDGRSAWRRPRSSRRRSVDQRREGGRLLERGGPIVRAFNRGARARSGRAAGRRRQGRRRRVVRAGPTSDAARGVRASTSGSALPAEAPGSSRTASGRQLFGTRDECLGRRPCVSVGSASRQIGLLERAHGLGRDRRVESASCADGRRGRCSRLPFSHHRARGQRDGARRSPGGPGARGSLHGIPPLVSRRHASRYRAKSERARTRDDSRVCRASVRGSHNSTDAGTSATFARLNGCGTCLVRSREARGQMMRVGAEDQGRAEPQEDEQHKRHLDERERVEQEHPDRVGGDGRREREQQPGFRLG